MSAKTKLKIKAISLRKQGKTYSEILDKVSVAKSTLSLWLRDVGLSSPQKQRITKKRKEAQMKGALARHTQRVELTKEIYEKAESEIKSISKRELWLMGVMLYWAEGSKEKAWRPGSGLDFSNSDQRMIRVYIKWLIDICNVDKKNIQVGIYIHENSKNRINKVEKYWSDCTGIPKKEFSPVYYKKHNPKTKRKNTEDLYYGNLRVKVRSSSTLVRKVEGWVRGIVKQSIEK